MSEGVEEMRARMVATWTAAADRYADWVVDRGTTQGIFAAFRAALVQALAGLPAPRILDVAAANGEPSATLALALPHAHVVSTDLVPGYLELGRRRAERLGIRNITFETADAEDLGQYGTASFDAVTCSLGIMFVPRWEQAIKEFLRVLKPGGVLALTVWGPADRVPFFGLTRDLAAEYDPESVPKAASFTALRFADPTPLLEGLSTAGFREVQREELLTDFTFGKDVWWEGLLNIPVPIKEALTKAQERRPGEDVFEEARGKMQALLSANGCLTPEGDLCCTNNLLWFITAKKPL